MKKFILILCIMLFIPICTFGEDEVWVKPKIIRTYIPPKHHYSALMEKAFYTWSSVTNDKVVFYYVNTPKAANLEVVFVEKIAQPEGERPIGLTQKQYLPGRKIVHATIYIADKAPGASGKLLHKNIVYTTMLHEIGHALGLPHLDDKNCIMYPIANGVQNLTPTDIQAINDLYDWE